MSTRSRSAGSTVAFQQWSVHPVNTNQRCDEIIHPSDPDAIVATESDHDRIRLSIVSWSRFLVGLGSVDQYTERENQEQRKWFLICLSNHSESVVTRIGAFQLSMCCLTMMNHQVVYLSKGFRPVRLAESDTG